MNSAQQLFIRRKEKEKKKTGTHTKGDYIFFTHSVASLDSGGYEVITHEQKKEKEE